MATNETYLPGQLYLINLSELLPDPDQPRKYLDPAALTEMVGNILRSDLTTIEEAEAMAQ